MSDLTQWGASPDDWYHLAFVCGLTEDMLPYIADPSILPSENTKWTPTAKMPSAVGSNGLGHGIKGWRTKVTTPADIDRFASEPAHGICIITRNLRAIDVDVFDQDEADEVERIITKHLGEIPTRRRANSTKFLCPVWVPGEFAKRKVRTSTMDRTGRYHSAVEVLADGQQFFAVGMHESGVRYEWGEALPPDFPTITLGQLDALLQEIREQVGAEDVMVSNMSAALTKARSKDDINAGDFVAQHLVDNAWIKEIDSRTGAHYIVCPFEHGHSKADTDNTATVYFPAGVGGMDQGHFNCMHQSCKGYTDADFIEAIGAVTAQFEVVEVPEGQLDAPPFVRNDKGKILSSIRNVMLALRTPEWLGVNVASDDFQNSLMLQPHGQEGWRMFSDADYTRLRLQMGDRGLDASLELTKEGVALRADENRFDSAQLWLEREVPEWDGVPRIDQFYPRCYGAPDTAYARAVGAYTWTALAARVLDPGHKVDMVPILTSGEGCRKSESIAAMVPDRSFFVELDLTDDDDDLARLMRGRLIAELGEMRGMNKRLAGEVKSFITRAIDEWTPKYKEFSTRQPRRLLFIGTSNELELLSDNTGRRRWLPLVITRADTDLIERERLQMWAEGRARFKANGRVEFEAAEELARMEHHKFEEDHPWEEIIRRWLDTPADFDNGVKNGNRKFTMQEAAVGALGLQVSHDSYGRNAKKLGVIFRKLGFEYQQLRAEGVRGRFWVKNEGCHA